MLHIIGLGEYVVSNHPGDILKTFALGSCIGVTVYCKKPLALAMAHIVLPDSTINTEKSFDVPGHFADTAMEILLLKLCGTYGCNPKDLEIKLFGGAQTFWENDMLSIGQRNYQAVKRVLTTQHLSFDDSEVGGSWSRTITIDGTDGKVNVIKYDLAELLIG